MNAVYTHPVSAEYRPQWEDHWTPCTVVGHIKPAGRVGRFFGATQLVNLVTVEGDSAPFATQAVNLRYGDES